MRQNNAKEWTYYYIECMDLLGRRSKYGYCYYVYENGKWIKDVRCVKTLLSGSGGYLYRLYVVYDDFTEEAVPFVCQGSYDGRSWESYGEVSEDGIVLDWSVRYVRFETVNSYYDFAGTKLKWNAEVG